MEHVLDLIRESYPEIFQLFQPVNANSELIKKAKIIGLPNDYYQLYSLVDGEVESSHGVFGLHRFLPLVESLENQITDPEALIDIPRKFQYDLFVPLFQTPGRQLIGYAKYGHQWDFAEYDVWLGKLNDQSLTTFLDSFYTKLKQGGYVTEQGINGLIDQAEKEAYSEANNTKPISGKSTEAERGDPIFEMPRLLEVLRKEFVIALPQDWSELLLDVEVYKKNGKPIVRCESYFKIGDHPAQYFELTSDFECTDVIARFQYLMEQEGQHWRKASLTFENGAGVKVCITDE
ncbi:hypothetical protein [Amphritea balenae]|uniref:SMI1/KNR4 family protein n=1 Tax=Amphritea balenae TaxID=452629 RepID=A0A3P1SR20_9GAMM|nr:hypothetical protein [Amphritea balenae]RRC98612.1 hypothetical protein EHS89_13455 [Amphritea balenae]GGK65924.1 hypothetical protein GCM10007941_15190 [Amphritea balenae]